MAASVGKATNIKTVEFDVILENLKEFEQYCTETFYLRGNPWAIKFQKTDADKEDVKKGSLACYLRSKIDTPLKKWAIIANVTVRIYSNKFDTKSILYKIEPHSFFDAGGWGRSALMKWDELMDPERGYVHNDMCKIGIKVNASPLQFPNDCKMLEFVPALKCCDATSIGEFRMKINEVYDFFDICSPEFTLKHFPWRLLICKDVTSKNDEKEEFLHVRLYNPSFVAKNNMSCKVTLLCKLVPYEKVIEPISKKLENQQLKYGYSECNLNIISWKELMNPYKKFVQNNSFVLKIIIEVTEATEQEIARTLEREAKDENNQDSIRLECPICFKWLIDQPLSVLICGHMYCTACIAISLQQKKICPSCNRDIPKGELQKIYLPTK